MRILRRSATPKPPTIAVSELAEHGLDGHPDAVAVVFPSTELVVCRKHAGDPMFRSVVARRLEPTDRLGLVMSVGSLELVCLRCALAVIKR